MLVIEQGDFVQLGLQVVAPVLLVAEDLKYLFPHLGKNLGACHLLEQSGFLVLVAVKEFGKLTLGEHDSTEELVHVEPDEFGDMIVDFGDLVHVDSRHDTLVGT